MRSYHVLVYSGRPLPPALHVITAIDDEMSSERADQLLVESLDAIGVEVTHAGQRLYARGAVPNMAAAERPHRRISASLEGYQGPVRLPG